MTLILITLTCFLLPVFASFAISAVLICKTKKIFVNKVDTEKSKLCEKLNRINFIDHVKEDRSNCLQEDFATDSLAQITKETDCSKITISSMCDTNVKPDKNKPGTNPYNSVTVDQMSAVVIIENASEPTEIKTNYDKEVTNFLHAPNTGLKSKFS